MEWDKRLEQLWNGVSVDENTPELLATFYGVRPPRQAPLGPAGTQPGLLAALILAPDQREDVRLTKLAAQLPGTAIHSSKIKQLHRFFRKIRLPEDVLARFVLSFADPKERLWLVMDRTNWRLGKTEINILLVAVISNGQALPLMWSLRPMEGAATQPSGTP